MYVGIWRCFCEDGWVWKTTKKFADGLFWTLECNDTSRLLEKKRRKKKKRKTLCCKIWTWRLEMPATPIPMFTCKWSYFKGLYPKHTDAWYFTAHMSKNRIQNTWVKHPWEKSRQTSLQTKFHWKIFIRPSAIISKSV